MREMKETGVVWLPVIPTNWNIDRVKNSFTISKDLSPENNPTVLKLARSGVQVKDVTTNEGQMAASYDNYNKVQPGDLLLNPMDLYSGANCNVSEISGVISPAYANLRPNGNVNSKFFDYYFKIQYWTMAMFAHGKGVSYDNRWTINNDSIKNYEIPVPSFEEQGIIVEHINAGTKKVDALIANQEQQIEKLKAYKQSLITEVVTKGLNPDVPMKPSGVEWIGEIPEHWGTPKIKYYCSIESGGTPIRTEPTYWNGTIPWLKTGELMNNEIFSSTEKITELGLECSSAKVFPINTILMAMYGQGKTRGMTGLLKIPCATNQACVGITLKDNRTFDVYFLWWCLKGAYDSIRKRAVGSGQPNLSGELVSGFEITLPTMEEQVQIVEYLDEKCAKIDRLIEIKQQKIDKLNDYKKSLIYEYVTGKKEV